VKNSDIKDSNNFYDNTKNHREKSIGFGFDIRDYIDSLEPAKKKRKYICPGCGEPKLSINQRTGAYTCYGCYGSKDGSIREAIAPRRNRDEFKPDEFDRKIAQKRLDNERKRERELKLKTEKLSKSLNPIERDTEHRKILSQLTLSDEHKDYLVNRLGFPLEALERCRTVEPKQRLTYQINKNLAGVNPISGMSLTNGEKGILVAFPDADGYLVGLKFYNPKAKETGNPKSKWFSSDWFDIGTSPKFSNGEQPIAVYYPETITDLTKIGLCEGVEWKAQEAANRLGYPVIGFSGISFLNLSPETTKAAIATIQAKTGINNDVKLIPIPDGGLVQNSANIKIVQDFIKNATHKCAVAWWGQFNKSDGDIDEINQGKIDSIQYLTPDEFFDIANLEQWKLQKKLEYKKLKIYTPTQVVNYDYISKMPTPEIDGKIIFFRASLGTGKTTLMLKILREFCLLKGAFISGCRNGLLHNIVGESNGQIIHINSNKSEFNDQDNTAWFTACWESILKINKEWFIGKLLVMDEITSQMHHLFFSKTLEGKRYEILERFLYIIQVSSGIIAFDGHLFDGIPNLFRKICPTKTVECISNEFVIERPKINFLEGTINNQKIKPNDKSPWLRHAKDTIRTAPISMASDSRIFLKSVAEILNGLGKKGLLITSETINKLEVREFLKDPDKWILENKPDYLFYSPSAESGLNVPIKDYFKAFYAFYFGVLGVDAQRQMLMRIRDINCPRWVWLRSHSIVTENSFKYNYTSPEVIGRLIEESNLLDVGNIGDILEDLKVKIESFAAPIIELVNEYKTIAEYERIAFRECFLEAVTNDGYEVERFTPETDEETKQELKLKTKAIKDRESLEIFNASDKFIGQGKIILGEKATDDDRRAAKKAEIVNLLPTINEDLVWSPEFIRFINFERFGITSQRRRYLMATNLDLSRRLANKRYANYVHRAGFCPWDMKFEYAQAKAIASSGILELIEERVHRLTADHPLIQKIVQNCKKTSIHRALGRFPGKDPIKFVLWLLGLLGYKTKYQSIKSNGKVIREYFLDTDDITHNQAYFNAIDKFLTYSMELKSVCFQDNKIHVEYPENETFKNDLSDSTQTNTGHGFESVADRGDIFIKNRGDLQPPQMKVEVVKVVPKNHPQNETQNQASGVKNQPTTGAVITLKMLKSLQIGDRRFMIWNDDLNEWESSEITAICPNSILFTTSKGFPLWISENNLNYLVLDEFEGMRA
jgi:hypothetical protein